MLKQTWPKWAPPGAIQPPSGGCVLKPKSGDEPVLDGPQPPSGGCVLKQAVVQIQTDLACPAAFRRLCVETPWLPHESQLGSPSRLQAAVC